MNRFMTMVVLGAMSGLLYAETIPIGRFSSDGLSQWQHHRFSGVTRYRLVLRGNEQRLRAESEGGASALFRTYAVDLRRTPYLNWRWKVDENATIPDVDEHTRAGDDYPARIYVVTRTGPLPWQTKAVNYVWSNNQAPEQRWTSAFTDSSLMIAVRSGNAETGRWLYEKRNVKADLEQFLGTPVDRIELVALMSDSDQTGVPVAAEYGDIYFSRN